MSNLLYNPVIDLGAALFLVGIVLTLARHNVRRFAWVVVLGAAVVLGGWFFPLQSAQLGALLHFPAAKTALRSVPVSQIRAIAAGKAPANELTPQYVAGLKLDPSASGFSGFNGEAKAIANSPMAHNAKWVAETAVLAVLEGNGPLATALGYTGSGVVGARPDAVLTGVDFQATLGSVQFGPVVMLGGGPTPPQVQREMAAYVTEDKYNAVKCSPTMGVKTSAYSSGSRVSASGVIELARAGNAHDILVGCNQNLPFRVTLLRMQVVP